MKSTKEKIAKILLVVLAIITTFQGLIPTLPGVGQHTTTLISAIAMYLVTILGVWRQYVSPEISNAAIKTTLVVAVVATLGGLNDLINFVHFSEIAEQWVRFGITLLTLLINVVSKIIWPTEETKSII